MSRLEKRRVLRYFLLESIRETIEEETLSGGSVRMVTFQNHSFVDRVIIRFIQKTRPFFSVDEVIRFLIVFARERGQ